MSQNFNKVLKINNNYYYQVHCCREAAGQASAEGEVT